MDTNAIIGDAIVYIKMLQQEVNDLEEEARSISDEEYKNVPVKWYSGCSMEDIQDRSPCIEPKTSVEVYDARKCFIYLRVEMTGAVRSRCTRSGTGGCGESSMQKDARVVEKLGTIGFAVTTFDGKVLAILMLMENGEPVAAGERVEGLFDEGIVDIVWFCNLPSSDSGQR